MSRRREKATLTACPSCNARLWDVARLEHRPSACDGFRFTAGAYADGWVVVGDRQRPEEADWWPEVQHAPAVGLHVSGIGIHTEVGIRRWWVRGGDAPAAEVRAAATIVAVRDDIAWRDALRAVLRLDRHEIAGVLRNDEVPVRAPAGDLLFRHGVLGPARRTPAGDVADLLEMWERGAEPYTVFDVVEGSPPSYERVVDPAPALSGLRWQLAVAAQARLHAAAARSGLGWLHPRLEVSIGRPSDTPWAGWIGGFPSVALRLRPDWWWRVGRFGLDVVDGRIVLDADDLEGGRRRVTVSGRIDVLGPPDLHSRAATLAGGVLVGIEGSNRDEVDD